MLPNEYRVLPWMVMRFGQRAALTSSSTSGARRLVTFLKPGSPRLISFKVGRLTNPLETNISSILVLGTQLLALTEDGTRMLVWDIGSGGASRRLNARICLLTTVTGLQATIQFDSDFTATTMLHPSTYLNKVLVGSSQGSMQLWNNKTQYALYCVQHGVPEISDIGTHKIGRAHV